MLTEGWVKLYRSILEHPLFTQCPDATVKVFVACLVRANRLPTKWFDGRRQIEIPAGAFIFSERLLAKEFHVSRQKLRTALDWLIKLQIITRVATQQHSMLVIEKWGVYQSCQVVYNPGGNPPPTHEQPIGNPPITLEVEVKKLRREENTPPRLSKPLDEWAEELYSRHPKKRDKGLVGLALLSVLEKASDAEALIMEIDRRHAGWCKTTEWTEKNGRFAPTLAQWIDDHGWTQRPDTELPPPRRWVEED